MTVEQPPRDGWILIKAGESVVFDLENQSTDTATVNARVMQIRGAILSSAFNLENILETLAVEFLFPQQSSDSEKRSFLQMSILREMNFERKTRIASAIAEKVLKQDEAKTFATKIGEVRQLRNLMAHYPCSFEPVKDERERAVSLKIFIAKGRSLYEINEEQITKWNALLLQTLTISENIVRKIAGELPVCHPLDQPPPPAT